MSFRKWNESSKESSRLNGNGERLIPIIVPNYYTPDYDAPPPLVARLSKGKEERKRLQVHI